MTEALRNSSFSLHIPELQVAWDSTSLGALKRCPTYYDYSIRQGLVPRDESIHLEFGLELHSASELYNKLKVSGMPHDDAVVAVVRQALVNTWDKTLGRPREVFCNDKNKNRYTLVRTIVWYFDQFKDDKIETIVLSNGRPATELSFRIGLDFESPTGEPYTLCGHMDRLGLYEGTPYVIDIKTTKYTLDDKFFAKYNPHNQFSLYALAGKIAYNMPVRGVIVDAAQIAVTFSRFMRWPVQRDEASLEEWLEDTHAWIRMAEGFARTNQWPKNDAACDMYGGCPYREVCSKSPLTRRQWLDRGFTHRVWDPLQRRGDI